MKRILPLAGWKRNVSWSVLAIVLALVVAAGAMRFLAWRPIPEIPLIKGEPDTNTLVVVVHGLNGAPSRDGMLAIARQEFHGADVLAPVYFSDRFGVFSNADPYTQADALEVAINRQFESRSYEQLVLIGHSMGASLLRKAFVWACGEESDRRHSRGKRKWVRSTKRIVSLAGINRGWTIEPRPRKMSLWRAWQIRTGEFIAAMTGTGRFILDLRRGSPFVADLRVQWMRVARRATPDQPMPETIHLLGTEDDIVNNDDSRDLCAATGVKFVTLPNTGHAEIAAALAHESTSGRARTIREAIAGRLGNGEFDLNSGQCNQIHGPQRLVFIVHGIRDFAEWGEALKTDIDAIAKIRGIPLVVEPAKYGWFPMAPFLLRPDRQEKVRWFMDQYTDALAIYPDATEFDIISHSNGTYILGAALARYRTIQFRDAYLAGSVLPQWFPWQNFIPGRVRSVRNIVAADDWVVAIFPRLFEQISEWTGLETVDSALDIGAAGFRGFLNLARGGVRNIRYAPGAHGVGVDILTKPRRDALLMFAVSGTTPEVDRALDQAFGGANNPQPLIDLASRISWLIWAAIAAVVIGLGAVSWRARWWAGMAYVIVVVALLNSI
jgi:hypothetical protein